MPREYIALNPTRYVTRIGTNVLLHMHMLDLGLTMQDHHGKSWRDPRCN